MIPLLIVQLALLGYTLYHILTHDSYKRGTRALAGGCDYRTFVHRTHCRKYTDF